LALHLGGSAINCLAMTPGVKRHWANVVERCFCRLMDWRRITTRYDKPARNFLSALCFVPAFDLI